MTPPKCEHAIDDIETPAANNAVRTVDILAVTNFARYPELHIVMQTLRSVCTRYHKLHKTVHENVAALAEAQRLLEMQYQINSELMHLLKSIPGGDKALAGYRAFITNVLLSDADPALVVPKAEA